MPRLRASASTSSTTTSAVLTAVTPIRRRGLRRWLLVWQTTSGRLPRSLRWRVKPLLVLAGFVVVLPLAGCGSAAPSGKPTTGEIERAVHTSAERAHEGPLSGARCSAVTSTTWVCLVRYADGRRELKHVAWNRMSGGAANRGRDVATARQSVALALRRRQSRTSCS